jgi:hypothetical protein
MLHRHHVALLDLFDNAVEVRKESFAPANDAVYGKMESFAPAKDAVKMENIGL